MTPPSTGAFCLAAPVNVAIGAEVVAFGVETAGAELTGVVGAGGGATGVVDVVHCDQTIELDAGGAGTGVVVAAGWLQLLQVTGGAGLGVVLGDGVFGGGGGAALDHSDHWL